ncbi:uncharacterized protein A4U43_C04F29460 [Asparagus officinalis]|uniref:Brix domain-containing protein n=1 Tax=Asparagus officinalis TaxID=4686 RepID=A0A5P1F7A7_ASPOF|nr:uncharacterized protein A4U43_C04F29460 [Asparagus officinalis]
MGKKRKQVATSEDPKKEEEWEPERPKRTLLGFKDGAIVEKKGDHPVFRNKDKVSAFGVKCCVSVAALKGKDLYLWMAKSPGGSSVKFLVHAGKFRAHNGRIETYWKSLKGSRPILTFSSNFNNEPRWMLLKEIITQIRALEKKKKAGRYAKKVEAKTKRKKHETSNQLEPDEFADMWKDE